MMGAMPRPRPPYLSPRVTRHGNSVWYLRRGGKRIRLRAEYGTLDFDAEYQAAVSSSPKRPQKDEPAAGTLGWLISSISRDGRMDGLLLGHTAPAGKHPQAGLGDCRR